MLCLEYFKYIGVRNEKRDTYIDDLQSVIKSLSDKNLNANDLFAHSTAKEHLNFN